MAFVPEDITLWVLLVAPGLIAVQLAIWLGVVETSLSDSRMLVASLVSSIFIDTLFFGLYQAIYGPIGQIDTAESIFFTPNFRPELVLGLLVLSITVGLLYAQAIIHDVTGFLRGLVWGERERIRYPGQPWEGVLKDADIVRVDTDDDTIVIGRLGDYSRLDKPKELSLRYPQWYDPSTGRLVDAEDETVLLFEDDIRRIVVKSRVASSWYRETREYARQMRRLLPPKDQATTEGAPEAVEHELSEVMDNLVEHTEGELRASEEVTDVIWELNYTVERIEQDGTAEHKDDVLALVDELERQCEKRL